jgi:trafficking protein particle complex subunit 10
LQSLLLAKRLRSHSWVDPLSVVTDSGTVDEDSMTPRNVDDIPEANSVLRGSLARVASFEGHFIDVTARAARNFGLAKRFRTVVRLEAEIASILFYRKKYVEAEPLLRSLSAMYKHDGWTELVSAVQIKLAECQRLLGQNASYLASCMQLATPGAGRSDEEREVYLAEALRVAAREKKEVMRYPLDQVIQVALDLDAPRTMFLGQKIVLSCSLTSCLPKPVSNNPI